MEARPPQPWLHAQGSQIDHSDIVPAGPSVGEPTTSILRDTLLRGQQTCPTAEPGRNGQTGLAPRDLRNILAKALALIQPVARSDSPLPSASVHISSLRKTRIVAIEHHTDFSIHAGVDPSVYLVDLTIRGTAHHRLDRQILATSAGTGIVHAPGSLFQQSRSRDYEGLFVQIERCAMEERLGFLLHHPPREPVRFSGRIDAQAATHGFSRIVSWIRDELGRTNNAIAACESVAFAAEGLLIDTLLTTHPNNYTESISARRSVPVPRHLRAVMVAIDGAPEQDWTLSDLASAGEVSVRTLCAAFRRFRGCTPMEHVRAVRLERAHRELRTLGDRTCIADVARRWGFGHPGRFAAIYRRVYGQAPSRTMRCG